MRVKVAIIGAGPAGMLLGHMLARAGIDAIVLEQRTRDYVEGRVRAGILEQITVDLIDGLGLGARMRREGIVHGGTNIAFDGDMFRIDMAALTGGKSVMVYGQQEVMRDLFDAAAARGVNIVFEAENVRPHDVESDKPHVTYRKDGVDLRVECDFVVGCDGYHGVSRQTIPAAALRLFERVYPFGWLGVLADVPPCNEELIYSNHERGFALASMRSHTRSRYYVQCGLDENVQDWPDARFWDEVSLRLGPDAARNITRGPSFEKTIAPLRSFVCETMRYGRLFLCGDAAHIVPPTGAKGLNLAASDVIILFEGLEHYYAGRGMRGIDAYAARALSRVWKAERFSWWFTGLTHRFPDMDPFARKMQIAELDYIRGSTAAQAALSENYVGLDIA